MAHAQKPDIVFRRNGRVHLNRRGASVQSTTGSGGVRISGSSAVYTVFRGSVKSTGYPIRSPVSPSLPPPVRHRVSSHFNWSLLTPLLQVPNHLLTYLLTPWCRVLPEQLTGLQLVKKFPAFHGTRRFITALTSVRHLSLSWASPIQSTCPHPTSWRSILMLSTHLRLGLPSGLFPSCFPTKTILRIKFLRNKLRVNAGYVSNRKKLLTT